MFDVATPVDWDAVLERIENGEIPSDFCSGWTAGMPRSAGDIERHAAADSGFAVKLTLAKQIGAKVMLAECIAIAQNRSFRPDERKLMIDARKYLAAIWNAECNPKTVVEQTTTVRSLTPREEYIDQCVTLLGMTREQAAARYAVETGATVQ